MYATSRQLNRLNLWRNICSYRTFRCPFTRDNLVDIKSGREEFQWPPSSALPYHLQEMKLEKYVHGFPIIIIKKIAVERTTRNSYYGIEFISGEDGGKKKRGKNYSYAKVEKQWCGTTWVTPMMFSNWKLIWYGITSFNGCGWGGFLLLFVITNREAIRNEIRFCATDDNSRGKLFRYMYERNNRKKYVESISICCTKWLLWIIFDWKMFIKFFSN